MRGRQVVLSVKKCYTIDKITTIVLKVKYLGFYIFYFKMCDLYTVCVVMIL